VRRRHVINGLVATAIAVAAGAGLARPAHASGGGDIPAISQYVESLPAASGGSPPAGGGKAASGGSSAAASSGTVPAPVARAVIRSGGGDRKALLELAATAPRAAATASSSYRLVAPARRGALSGLAVGDLTPLVVLALAIAISAFLAALLSLAMRSGPQRRLVRSDS
jgi:hypothetical protein